MTEKFQNNLKCVCNNIVIFEIIDDVECNWGTHTIIQCPKCEELFTVDKKCPAFQNMEQLLQINNIDSVYWISPTIVEFISCSND